MASETSAERIARSRAERYAREQNRTQDKTRRAAEDSVRHARKQTDLLSAMKDLSEQLAQERRDNAERENKQQAFNKRMSWAAVILAAAAVVVPFLVLWMELALR